MTEEKKTTEEEKAKKEAPEKESVEIDKSEGNKPSSAKAPEGSASVTTRTSQTDEEKKEGTGEKAEVPKPTKKKKKNIRRQVQRGKAFIKSTYNNTTITFSDLHGNVLAWSSAGLLGFKGAKKATTYAAAQVVGDAHDKVQRYGLRDVEVFIKGVGSGRDSALRTLVQKGYNLTTIKDVTPLPHNGCRPPKPRRV